MRDVNYGWLLRYLHANGASMFFLAAYIHMFRGMYYGSYKEPREVLWILGVILLLLMIMTGFMGYVLPWGQMSFWAATVITNLFSAIPLVGEPIVTWLWGGYAVGNPTLNRFYSLHYLLPFVIVGVVVLHIWALHVAGQNNPTGIEPKTEHGHGRVHALCDDQGQLPAGGVLHPVRLVRVLHAEFSRPSRQLHSGQSGGDADAHRAGMVLPAVLRDPARDPEQAPRRDRARRLDPDPRVPAVARYLEGALGALPAALSAVLLGVRDRLHRARLARLEAAGRQLRAVRAHLHGLLLRLFPDHPAGARHDREDQAAAELDLGIGAARGHADRRAGAAASGARLEGTPWPSRAQSSLSPSRSRRSPAPRRAGAGARHAAAADATNGRSRARSANTTARSSSAASRSIARSARSATA